MILSTQKRIVLATLLILGGSAALYYGLKPFSKPSSPTGISINGRKTVRPPPPKISDAVAALLDPAGQPTGKFEALAWSPFQLRVQFRLAPGERPPSAVLLCVYHDRPGGKQVMMQSAMADVARVDDEQYEAVLTSNPIRLPGEYRAVVTTSDHRLPAVLAEQRISILRR